MHVKEQEDDDTDELLKQAVPTTDSTQEEEDEERKQATTHISVPPNVVLASKGKEREKWLEAGRREIDNLTLPKAITTISPQEKSALRDLARVNGENYVELPSREVQDPHRCLREPDRRHLRQDNHYRPGFLHAAVPALLGSLNPKERHRIIRCDCCLPQCRPTTRKDSSPETAHHTVQAGVNTYRLCMEGSPHSLRSQRGSVAVVAGENHSDGKMAFR